MSEVYHLPRYENNKWENLDGTNVDTAALNWKDGKPNTGDSKHCGMMHNGLMEDWSCTGTDRYLCKIGSNACGPSSTCS